MKLRRLILALVLMAALLLSCSASAFADPTAFSLQLLVGEKKVTVRALQNDYPDNYYISLWDLSAALDGTPRSFRFAYQNTTADGEFFTVTTGVGAGVGSAAGRATEKPWTSSFVPFRNRIFVNGQEHRYYTYREGRDLYMSLTDIQLMLDLPAELQEEGVRLYPDQHFCPDAEELDRLGYFDAFSAVLVADADTGCILFSRGAQAPMPIASISKLMTYLLLASSNECALALAEHLAGSEEAFVARMNDRAAELGLETAHFYNPHGLPLYLNQALSTKVGNCMSAEDLFALCQLLLHDHPELNRITRERYGSMPSLNYVTANSNALVFNMEGCNGLKTGSTNKAGSCLAASMPVTVGGETHTAVVIVLGAEAAYARNQAAEILMRYARDTWQERGFLWPDIPEETAPDSAAKGA